MWKHGAVLSMPAPCSAAQVLAALVPTSDLESGSGSGSGSDSDSERESSGGAGQ